MSRFSRRARAQFPRCGDHVGRGERRELSGTLRRAVRPGVTASTSRETCSAGRSSVFSTMLASARTISLGFGILGRLRYAASAAWSRSGVWPRAIAHSIARVKASRSTDLRAEMGRFDTGSLGEMPGHAEEHDDIVPASGEIAAFQAAPCLERHQPVELSQRRNRSRD